MLVLRKWIQDEGKRHEDMRQRHEDAQNDKISKLTTAVEKLCMQREDDRRVAEQRREDDRRVAEQRREDSLKREGATREEMAEIKSQLRNLCQQHKEDREEQRAANRELGSRIDDLGEKVTALGERLTGIESQFVTFRDLVTPHVLPARRPSDMDTDAAHAQDAPAAGHAPETTA
ncbi:MAG: hypothetical protein OXU85_05960 [Thaumarchaeota archaeon]|nr:hypothetical protein [Nitrososphaerota archaeon]